MTIPKFAIAATLAGALLCSAGSRKADASIQVDFQPSTGVTQAGFTGVSSNTTTLLPSGIKLTTTGLFFDRSPGYTNGGAFTYEDLMDDFAYAGLFAQVGNAPITLTIENLTPNYDYRTQIWSGDYFTNSPNFATQIQNTYTPTTGTGAAFSTIFSRIANPLNNDQYSGTGIIRSDATGKIVILITASPAPGSTGDTFTRLNGLSLEAVPEPATIAVWSLLGIGAAIAYGKNRKK